jgi:hypothetical protein
MAALLIRHRTASAQDLAATTDLDRESRVAYGGQGCEVFRNAGDPGDVMIYLEWDDPERARLYADSDDFRGAKVRAGLTEPFSLWVLNDHE